MAETFSEALDYLNSFLNLEKKLFYSYKDSLKLDRVKKAAEYLGISYNQLRIVHVAGTKGKGSTAHFLAYMLASLGYRVGVFSSPHFFTFRERMKIVEVQNDSFRENLISRKKATSIINHFKKKLFFLEGEKLTYFELITLIGLQYFKDKKPDYVVLEVGLGGRLDSTNIINPELSVITHIGYDHMYLLGDSLAEIAYEKAGIIKDKKPVVSSYQRSSAAEVIKKTAKKKKSNLYFLGADFKTTNIRMKKNSTFFDFELGEEKIENLRINQKGYYQVENAGLAMAALFLIEKKKKKINLKLKKALSCCTFEGRFELLSKDPLTVVDVAHNKSSALAVSDNLAKYFPAKKIILVFSCSADKKPNQILSSIKYDHLILTQFSQPRAYDVFSLKAVLWRKRAIVTMNLPEALKKAKSLYDEQSLILVCGSFFLAAEAKTIFQKRNKNRIFNSKIKIKPSKSRVWA